MCCCFRPPETARARHDELMKRKAAKRKTSLMQYLFELRALADPWGGGGGEGVGARRMRQINTNSNIVQQPIAFLDRAKGLCGGKYL